MCGWYCSSAVRKPRKWRPHALRLSGCSVPGRLRDATLFCRVRLPPYGIADLARSFLFPSGKPRAEIIILTAHMMASSEGPLDRCVGVGTSAYGRKTHIQGLTQVLDS